MIILKDAIKRKRLVQFHYGGHVRKVEPYVVGQLTSDNMALRAWHLEGFTESHREPSWRLYLLKDIRSLRVLDEVFDEPRDGYNPDDSMMSHIYGAYSSDSTP